MAYVTEEMLEEIRRLDLLTYLREYEPYELIKLPGNNY